MSENEDMLTQEGEIEDIGGFEITSPGDAPLALTEEDVAFLDEFEEKFGVDT